MVLASGCGKKIGGEVVGDFDEGVLVGAKGASIGRLEPQEVVGMGSWVGSCVGRLVLFGRRFVGCLTGCVGSPGGHEWASWLADLRKPYNLILLGYKH